MAKWYAHTQTHHLSLLSLFVSYSSYQVKKIEKTNEIFILKTTTNRAQGVRTDKFEMYDYGTAGNKQHYGQSTPPQYELSKIDPSLPIYLYSGGNDILADPTDVKRLVDSLPTNKANFGWKVIPDYAHLDFGNNNAYWRTTPFLLLQGWANI